MAKAKKKGSFGTQAKAAGGVLVLLLAAHGMKTHHGHGVTANLDSIGSSNLSTRDSWARALLRADGLPRTSCNIAAVVAWELHEGGGFGNQAAFDPLNVNPGAGANWPGHNAIGAWAFPDAATGLRYTVRTLNNGNYGAIISALQAGTSDQAVLTAVENSPWAQSHYGYALSAPPC
jgi:hypothetical protein